MAYVSPYISLGMIALVAVRWLLPPKKIVELTRNPKEAARHQLAPSPDDSSQVPIHDSLTVMSGCRWVPHP